MPIRATCEDITPQDARLKLQEWARQDIGRLTFLRDVSRNRFFSHVDPGGQRPAELEAWVLEHEAYELLLKAAQMRLDAEIEMQQLLALEANDG